MKQICYQEPGYHYLADLLLRDHEIGTKLIDFEVLHKIIGKQIGKNFTLVFNNRKVRLKRC